MHNLLCPICHSILIKDCCQVICEKCRKSFPMFDGIPDLRVFGPTEHSIKTDTDGALHLMSLGANSSFVDLILENARLSKEEGCRSNDLIDYYTNISLSAEQREVNRFDELKLALKKRKLSDSDKHLAIDLGTGMGPALPLLASQFEHVLAVDISMKHLVIAKKRCTDRGLNNVTYVCACAERLPIEKSSGSYIHSTDLLEHVVSLSLFLSEAARILGPAGLMWGCTPNRFTILPEGHVNVWGVGFLPRPLQRHYVRLLRRTDYVGIRPVSYVELLGELKDYFDECAIVLPSDIHEALLPHPGVKSGMLWKYALRYWKMLEGSGTLHSVAHGLEKMFYPQFRFLARKR